MNKTATYIAARVARATHYIHGRQIWHDRKPGIMQTLDNLQPTPPDDSVPGFLAYNVDGHGRMKMRTGRFLTRKFKLNNGFLPDTAIQTIAAQINTELFGNTDEIRLDSGEQITRNYKDSIGGNSCMCGNAAEYTGLYADNPDKIKQLVMISINDTARAIVHVLDNGMYHMSRVYATSEDLKQRMITYARDKEWLYCGDSIDDKIQLIVSDLDFTEGEIPFADSLAGYRIEGNGLLTMVHTSLHHDGVLDSTSGDLGNSYECACCNEDVSEDDIYRDDNGEIYCCDCFHEHFTMCGHCDETYSNESCTWVENAEKDVCEYCLDRHYTYCDDCNEYFSNSNTYSVNDGDKSVCVNCLEQHYTCCDECGEYFSDNIEYNKEKSMSLCDDCDEQRERLPVRVRTKPIKDCGDKSYYH